MLATPISLVLAPAHDLHLPKQLSPTAPCHYQKAPVRHVYAVHHPLSSRGSYSASTQAKKFDPCHAAHRGSISVRDSASASLDVRCAAHLVPRLAGADHGGPTRSPDPQ